MKTRGEGGLAGTSFRDKGADTVFNHDRSSVECLEAKQIQNAGQHVVDGKMAEGGGVNTWGRSDAAHAAAIGIDQEVGKSMKAQEIAAAGFGP